MICLGLDLRALSRRLVEEHLETFCWTAIQWSGLETFGFLYAILLGILAAFVFPSFLSRLRKTFFLFDTLGIGFFTVLGVEKALSLGVRPEIAAIMGMFSAVMGGVIRDTLTNEIPILFRKEVYASACLAGAILYLFLNYYGVPRDYNMLISMSLVISIRLISMKYKLSLPTLG